MSPCLRGMAGGAHAPRMVQLTEQQERELADLIAIDDATPLRISDARLGRLQELIAIRSTPPRDAAQPER